MIRWACEVLTKHRIRKERAVKRRTGSMMSTCMCGGNVYIDHRP